MAALCDTKMKRMLLLIITFVLLSGCVVYPSRHISEPSYEVKISGEPVENVSITSSLGSPEGSCSGGKNLKSSGDNNFVSEPEIKWIKLAFMVPVNTYRLIKICVLDKNGHKYYWSQNIGVMPNSYPDLWVFDCSILKSALTCSKST